MYKNKTFLGLDSQLELARVTSKTTKLLGVVLGLIFIVAGAFFLKTNDIFAYGFIIGGIVVIIIFLFFWNCLMSSSIKKNIEKKKTYDENTYNEFEFDEKEFAAIAYKDAKEIGSSKRAYADLVKVIETTNYWLLFIVSNQAFIIKKSATYIGSADDISSLLKSEVKDYKLVK